MTDPLNLPLWLHFTYLIVPPLVALVGVHFFRGSFPKGAGR